MITVSEFGFDARIWIGCLLGTQDYQMLKKEPAPLSNSVCQQVYRWAGVDGVFANSFKANANNLPSELV